MSDLKNKNIIVTGASGGIGNSIVEKLNDCGANVLATGTRLEKLEELKSKFNKIKILKFDISQSDKIEEFVENATKELGGSLDCIVNNAGITQDNLAIRMSLDEWKKVIDVNLTGVFRCCQEVLPHIQDFGRIINVGSLSGEYGGPRTPSYAVAKRGIMALTHNLARFLGNRNICVNTLSPGVIAGEFTEKTMAPDVKETALRLMLIKRFAKYDEMVGAAIFLASDESSYLTAQTISINGGAWSH